MKNKVPVFSAFVIIAAIVLGACNSSANKDEVSQGYKDSVGLPSPADGD